MTEHGKFYVNLSGLISQARLQNGYATLRELYRSTQPNIDYQTWLHAESGRRIPAANIVIQIGDILKIDREALIIAYCKDKFDDEESHLVLESFRYKKFINPATLIGVIEHDRSDDYIFTAEQVRAMQDDIRLRLYLSYTFNRKYRTTFENLAKFFKTDTAEVEEVVRRLEALNLVNIVGQEIHRIYPNTTMPKSADTFELRKRFLIKSLELNVDPESYFTNLHALITPESYRSFLQYLDFAEANLLKLTKEDAMNENRTQFQIAIMANRVKD